jgi:anti-sigma B factor antagonist
MTTLSSKLAQAGDLRIDVARTDGRAIVALSGELDVYTSPALRERVGELIKGGVSHVVIDLAGVSFIDSTGIGVLVGAHKRARGIQGTVELQSPRPGAMKALEITGLTQVLTIV